MTSPSAETRWWLASLLRHLQIAMPTVNLAPGALTTPPDSLPLIVIAEAERIVHPFLGGQVSEIENEQGTWAEITFAAQLYAAPDAWGHGVQNIWDALQLALAGGTIPLISEVEPDDPIHHGSLLVQLTPGNPLPHPSTAEARIADGPWQVRTGRLVLRGQLSWIAGGE